MANLDRYSTIRNLLTSLFSVEVGLEEEDAIKKFEEILNDENQRKNIEIELHNLFGDESVSFVKLLDNKYSVVYPADDESDAKSYMIEVFWNRIFPGEKVPEQGSHCKTDIMVEVNYLVQKIENLHPNDPLVHEYWEELTEILSRDKDDTITFINNLNDSIIVDNLSSVFEEVSGNLQSMQFIHCIESLQCKFPDLLLKHMIHAAKEALEDEIYEELKN